MRIRLINISLALLATLALGACSEEKFKAGEPAGEESQNVCFVGTEACYYMSEDKEAYVATLKLSRDITEGALTVGLNTVYTTEGLTLPAEARFDDGESTTTVDVTLTKEAVKMKEYKFCISVDPRYANNYSFVPGISQIYSCVQVADAKKMECYIVDKDDERMFEGEFFYMQCFEIGVKKYLIEDFMSTGRSLRTWTYSGNSLTVAADWIELDDEDGYTCWWMGDDPLSFGHDDLWIEEGYLYGGGYSYYYRKNDTSPEYLKFMFYCYMNDGREGYYSIWCKLLDMDKGQ